MPEAGYRQLQIISGECKSLNVKTFRKDKAICKDDKIEAVFAELKIRRKAMAITQLSAFLENTPGTLYKAVCAISDAGVNLRALSVADTRDFGILRVIVSDVDKTIAALNEDTVITRTSVIAVRMSDKAGALKEILSVLQEAGINIEYVYAFTANAANSAYVVLRVNDIEEAESILAEKGLETLNDEDLNTILP